MTNEEFSKLLSEHLYIALPSLAKWTEGLPNPQATLAIWRETLEDCTLAECVGVIKRWMLGELDPPEAFSRDLTAAKMRKAILEDRRFTKTASATVADKGKRNRDCTPIAPIFAKAIAMKQKGVSESEILEAVNALIPATNEYDGPRYRCKQCQDRGLIEVWRTDVARAVDRKEITADEATGTYNVACCCEAGEPYVASRLPVFSSKQYCRFRSRTLATERRQLRKWINAKFNDKKNQDFVAWEGVPA